MKNLNGYHRAGTALAAALLIASATLAKDVTPSLSGSNTENPVSPIIQKAIDEVAADGGGTVHIRKGRWTIGSLELKSGVALELEKEAELIGSTNLALYTSACKRALIYAGGRRDVTIRGEGLIDGMGGRFAEGSRRPGHLIDFFGCTNVTVEGVSLRGGGSWTLHPRFCDGVTIRGIDLVSHVNHCNDGIDIGSRNVLIENCHVDADDDAIVFKTQFPEMVVENVKVRNCRLASSCNFIKFGTETHGVTRNVEIENCTFEPPVGQARFDWRTNTPGVTNYLAGLAGLAFECVDGGLLENVTVRNIRGCGFQTPVIVRLGRRRESRRGAPAGLRNILVENYTATAGSRIACAVTGVPGLRPSNIVFRNCAFTQMPGGTLRDVASPVPERENAYPENRMFNAMPLPAWGFYVRHADGVRFEGVKLTRLPGREERPAIYVDDAEVSHDAACSFQPSDAGQPAVLRPDAKMLAELNRQYEKSLETGSGYFLQGPRPVTGGKPPLFVYCGVTAGKAKSYLFADPASIGFSVLLPFARDTAGVIRAVNEVKDRIDASAICLKADNSTLALACLAAAPDLWAAVTVANPRGKMPELGACPNVAVDLIVGAFDREAGNAYEAFNALAAPADRLSAKDIARLQSGQSPSGKKWMGFDSDYPEKVRPILFRKVSGDVRLTVCRTGGVSIWSPTVDWCSGKCRADARNGICRLIMAGDSTMQAHDASSKNGSWGDALTNHLAKGYEIVNCGVGGRSSRTYREIWEARVLPKIRRGDWVFIQFGHCDMSKASDPKAPERRTKPWSEYKANLRRFIADVRLLGGKPLLCTSITLYLHRDGGGLRTNSLLPWVEAMRLVAEETKTPLVDVNARTYEAMVAAGEKGSLPWYMKSINGRDGSHLTKAGALVFADIFAAEARKTLALDFLAPARK